MGHNDCRLNVVGIPRRCCGLGDRPPRDSQGSCLKPSASRNSDKVQGRREEQGAAWPPRDSKGLEGPKVRTLEGRKREG